MECRDINLVAAISELDISYKIPNIIIKFFKAIFFGSAVS